LNNELIFNDKKYNYSKFTTSVLRGKLVVCFLLIIFVCTAQQPSNITHYMFTNLSHNPAIAGSNDGISITALFRQQWMGFNGSPQTIYFSIDSPLKFLHGGIGGTILSDKIAQLNTTDVRLDYAYRFELGQGEFSAGAQLDINNTKVEDGSFVWIDDTDPVKRDLGKDDLVMDFSLGLFYKVPDKYYVGFSAPDILQSREKKIFYRLKRSYYLTGGYNWVVPNHPLFEIQPSVLLRYDVGSFQMDITGLVLYNKKFYGGLAYRYQDGISVLVGFNVKSLRIGIAYDASMVSALKNNSGGIEVMANYSFKISTDKFRKSYKNTRFL
jgi:type IX secretion system PorP/SprF family membrane protein